MKVKISAISYHLPETVEGVETLQRDNPDWDMPKILDKTGILNRHISAPGETAVDLAFEAGKKLLGSTPLHEDIDLLILVTQSPDYVLPTSACILQDSLALSKKCMAFDVNMGCSGFVYALSIAGSLIESGVAQKGLILCADTYTKYIGKNDRTCRPLFSDGAVAILLESSSYGCVAEVRNGSLFQPWSGYRFDVIVDDISGIASGVAAVSSWFQGVPCESGEDGVDLVVEVILGAPRHLSDGGSFFFPVLSLSNADKILQVAKECFRSVERVGRQDWPLPIELKEHIPLLKALRAKGAVKLEERFGMALCYTEVYCAKNPI